MSAPERIWAAHINDDRNGADIWFRSEITPDPFGRIVWQAEYVRVDIHDALIAERDALKAEVERLRAEIDEGLPSIAGVRGILSGICPTCGCGHTGPCAPQSATQAASPPPTATETPEPAKPAPSPLRGAAKGDRWA